MDEDTPVRLPAVGEQPVVFGAIKRGDTAAGLAAGIAAGNIFRQTADAEVLELPEASAEQARKQQELMREIELRRKMKATVVPTNDGDVRRMLRQLGEPITLFGEREMERRDRLRKLLAHMGEEAAVAALGPPTDAEMAEAAAAVAAVPTTEVFYTEGPPALADARQEIAQFSLRRAALRLAAAQRARENPDEDEVGEVAAAERQLRIMTNQASEIGDERPIAGCCFSPDGSQLATGAWSGTLKVWAMPSLQKQLTIKAHAERVTGVAWHPEASTTGRMEAAVTLASGATDATAKLWSGDGKLLRTLTGHTDRLGRIAFHPMGRHLGTASFDQTWRLWDVETGECLQEQEGHSRAVYAVAFQNDGALAASGGMDAIARIWDMRTGRNIYTCQGHVKAVLSLDFSPCGYLLATGSEDNTARVWDLRKRQVLSVLPGHTSLISAVRFEPDSGHYLLTAGYDNTSRLWGGPRFRLLRTLAGHEGKVMGADISPDGSFTVATTGYDRTIKLYGPDPLAEIAEEGGGSGMPA
ncbi:U4 U6 small nuclear ribonucleo PRP4 [Chlorella sorokiniana]|uniref:U4 U6 small nuclear ribonucleo PRP4 n=1 Tax=Chlorella sorokiniana TaxID=3076 RepID=A0A2P6TBB7_CHLSO|nr:U4 U6 small nuclear ribonucleo PRP4 [Chlorella sorokiniana]|eukprot:PRW05847.1 U4 U6 small nuclear ribonucleo PRP4 [Chlorella sorokiniana]